MYYKCLLTNIEKQLSFNCYFKYPEAPFQFIFEEAIFTVKKISNKVVNEVPQGELFIKRNKFYLKDEAGNTIKLSFKHAQIKGA
ncbi:hypothetical protein [Flammeovirga pacifica]|uniref:Uncharacterized protein n=1 Tax=Flammeovirga pacifica TaxID=915059 RepID=A0A1S1YWG2_FLAPC|nr:hypothetical protein [Flammeovirga pacifica]OHX65155.1 hypothetical protein NH26_01695 [Flammeovirga pacifica]